MQVDGTGLTIVASDGTSFTLTTAQIKAQAALEPNVQSLISWISAQIELGLGPGMVQSSQISSATVSMISGVVSSLEISS